MIDLDEFERALIRDGRSEAPNGAHYALTTYRDGPAIQRTTPGLRRRGRTAAAGRVEIIVGFGGRVFEGNSEAVRWAVTDGRHELGRVGASLVERQAIA